MSNRKEAPAGAESNLPRRDEGGDPATLAMYLRPTGLPSRRARRCLASASSGMPLDQASATALEGVLRNKRGSRFLTEHVVDALLAYFVAKNTGVVNLPLDPPSSPEDLEDWKEEWRDYARDAKLTGADVNNVARWIGSADASGAGGPRAGRARPPLSQML